MYGEPIRELRFSIKHDKEDREVAKVLVGGTLERHPYCFLLDIGAANTEVLVEIAQA